jgi:hypothetical protein
MRHNHIYWSSGVVGLHQRLRRLSWVRIQVGDKIRVSAGVKKFEVTKFRTSKIGFEIVHQTDKYDMLSAGAKRNRSFEVSKFRSFLSLEPLD